MRTFRLRRFTSCIRRCWITGSALKFDDQKNKALVEDEITELLRRRRKVRERGAGQLRDLRDGLADAVCGTRLRAACFCCCLRSRAWR